MKKIKNENGFTLVEMLIVMMIISVLLILIIPNVMKHQKTIQEKGCDAFSKNVQAQVQGYMLDHNGAVPTIEQLEAGNYISQTTCTDGSKVIIDSDGTVSVQK